MLILVFTVRHIGLSEEYCHSVRESNYYNPNGSFIGIEDIPKQDLEILQQNPELFYWDKCLYKVYPFTNGGDIPCQCRVFVIDWTDLHTTAEQRSLYFNLTQNDILTGMLQHWTMLEKFRTNNPEHSFGTFSFKFTSSMFKSVHMRAFEWTFAAIDSFEIGISSWKLLEYLKFEESHGLNGNGVFFLPSDFGQLQEMKYLSFIISGMKEIPSSICNLTQLSVLEIEWELYIESVPHCFGELKNLRLLSLDGSLTLMNIPFSIFSLPNLNTLSLFRGFISYESLLYYNLPIDIDINDIEMVNAWINENFDPNPYTKYWLSLNPICSENISSYRLSNFVNNTCDYLCSSSYHLYADFCPPRCI